ncbi:MAG: glycosyltransferase family 87 protein, partial [Pseudomonadota bacterium]
MGGNLLTRRIVYAAAIIFLAVNAALLVAIARTHPALWSEGQVPGLDFAAFWSASWMTLNGEFADAYVRELLRPVQAEATGDTAFSPWLYPPTFVLYILPLALVSYSLAYLGWVAATFSAFAGAVARIVPGERTILLLLAFPGTVVNVAAGQNGFLTAALFGAALVCLEKRPILAGVFFALLSYKPQFGLLIPFVLLAGRNWTVFASASISTLLLIAASLGLYGTAPWLAFIERIPASRELYEIPQLWE